MKKTVCALLLSVPLVLTLAAQQAPAPAPAAPPAPARSPSGADISWAFAATNGALPPEAPTTPNSVNAAAQVFVKKQAPRGQPSRTRRPR